MSMIDTFVSVTFVCLVLGPTLLLIWNTCDWLRERRRRKPWRKSAQSSLNTVKLPKRKGA